MAAVHHLGFLKVQNFNCRHSLGPMRISVPIFMPISQTISKTWPLFDFSKIDI